MRGFTAVASRRALSAGALLVFGGGLLLYQMTSLWLGPAGNREFHISLTIPVIEDELAEPKTSDVSLALGMLVAPGPSVPVAGPVPLGSFFASGAHRHVPAPAPVASQPPATHPSGHPAPPATVPKGDEAD